MVGPVSQQWGAQLITLKTPGKVNLVLEILGKRTDGYHEIKSIMQAVSLFDALSFSRAPDIKMSCNIPELQSENNLVLKAARLLKQVSGYPAGALIAMEKNIPWEAGLGGGSSDAAAALTGLNKLWSLGLPRERLAEIAADIGSDVPFFIYGGTCLSEGRGEKIDKLPDIDKTWFILLKPSLPGQAGKTGRLYGLIVQHQYTGGEYTFRMKQSIDSGHGLAGLYNVFDHVVSEAYPGLDRYFDLLRKAGAREIHLAGSGPVIFTALQDEKKAREIYGRVKTGDEQVYLVSSVPGDVVGY
jgi:4-diphosphocytidyl-2-C-methyl-D-erythritol kinase